MDSAIFSVTTLRKSQYRKLVGRLGSGLRLRLATWFSSVGNWFARGTWKSWKIPARGQQSPVSTVHGGGGFQAEEREHKQAEAGKSRLRRGQVGVRT